MTIILTNSLNLSYITRTNILNYIAIDLFRFSNFKVFFYLTCNSPWCSTHILTVKTLNL